MRLSTHSFEPAAPHRRGRPAAHPHSGPGRGPAAHSPGPAASPEPATPQCPARCPHAGASWRGSTITPPPKQIRPNLPLRSGSLLGGGALRESGITLSPPPREATGADGHLSRGQHRVAWTLRHRGPSACSPRPGPQQGCPRGTLAPPASPGRWSWARLGAGAQRDGQDGQRHPRQPPPCGKPRRAWGAPPSPGGQARVPGSFAQDLVALPCALTRRRRRFRSVTTTLNCSALRSGSYNVLFAGCFVSDLIYNRKHKVLSEYIFAQPISFFNIYPESFLHCK